jgi:hypothetical protein
MTSSGVYRFLGMTVTSLVAVQSNIHPGPDLPGQVSAAVALAYDNMILTLKEAEKSAR